MTVRAMVHLHALSPMHIGTGHSVDVIDLPISRERSTELPNAPGSAIKGVLRAEARSRNLGEGFVDSAFGPEKDPSEAAGAVVFGDGKLLLFPVRSVRSLFVWATSPYLLRRYARDRSELGLPAVPSIDAALRLGGDKAQVSAASLLVNAKVFLEDADLAAAHSTVMGTLANELAPKVLDAGTQELLAARFVLVSDGLLGSVVRQSTEVTARVKLLDDRKTVQKGGLWYEEALPSESVLYANVLAEGSRHKARPGRPLYTAQQHLDGLRAIRSIQIGGKASVGRGMCRLVWE